MTTPHAPDEPSARRLDASRYGRISDLAWSPDGRWLAYAKPETPQTQAIILCRSGSTPASLMYGSYGIFIILTHISARDVSPSDAAYVSK